MSQRWKLLKEAELMRASFFTLKTQQYELPDGRIMPEYYSVEFLDWVNVVALTRHQEIIMVKQYRPPGQKSFLEIPGGGVSKSDSNPLVAAQRELEEETGYVSELWTLLGSHYPNPSLLTNRMHTYLALDCSATGQVDFDPYEDLITELHPITELSQLLFSGQIDHSVVMASLLLCLKHLGLQLP